MIIVTGVVGFIGRSSIVDDRNTRREHGILAVDGRDAGWKCCDRAALDFSDCLQYDEWLPRSRRGERRAVRLFLRRFGLWRGAGFNRVVQGRAAARRAFALQVPLQPRRRTQSATADMNALRAGGYADEFMPTEQGAPRYFRWLADCG